MSGTEKVSPRSISGGCPRRVGKDRSGLVVASDDPSSETARITDSGSDGVVMVPAGWSLSDRKPADTSVSAPNAIRERSSPGTTVNPDRTCRYVFVGVGDTWT